MPVPAAPLFAQVMIPDVPAASHALSPIVHTPVLALLVIPALRLVDAHNRAVVALVMLALLEKLTAATSMHEPGYLEDEDAVRKDLAARGCVR